MTHSTNKRPESWGEITAKAIIFTVFLALAGLILCSCATGNTTTTKFNGKDSTGRTFSIEMPKDLEAEGIGIKTVSGATIKIKKIKSTGNVAQTKAQGTREKNNINAVSGLVEKGASGVSEGLVKGAVKSIKPVP